MRSREATPASTSPSLFRVGPRSSHLAGEEAGPPGTAGVPPAFQPKQISHRLRVRHMSLRTEKAYLHWIRRYILFHGQRCRPVKTTMIYTHVLNRGGRGVKSPVDLL